MVPTEASLVGSIMMPDPIMFTAVSMVNCTTPILLPLDVLIVSLSQNAGIRAGATQEPRPPANLVLLVMSI
ncbi:hypothetical protein KH20906_29940 [Edwardsiella ictaluri]|nr:hypothetical protein KH20906_29940 [Edwardsiella ictaluri]BEI21118.1 hypothetical protein STH22820_30180 [Edwardsiella ictaluri]